MVTMKIANVIGREVLDSRGRPTVEAEVRLRSGHCGLAITPSGASTGKFEAWELRDGGRRYQGFGVRKAVANVNGRLRRVLLGKDAAQQAAVDRVMIELDGTPNKSRLGANAILAVSMANAQAAAMAQKLPLYEWLAELSDQKRKVSLPLPMINIISGGLHAGGNLDVQDFLVIPLSARSTAQALEMVSDVWYATRAILQREKGYGQLIADEGGFGPKLRSNEEGLEILTRGIEKAGYHARSDVAIALDIASSHFYRRGKYQLCRDRRSRTADQMIELLTNWVRNYPVISIEDGLAEEDWSAWVRLTKQLGEKTQLIGDDLFATNPQRLRRGIAGGCANAILVKMNQIGTVSETLETIRMAQSAGYRTIVSARSGETEDCFMSDLAVGTDAGQIKIGSMTRSSRLAKYNQLLRIEERLGTRRFSVSSKRIR